MTVHRNKVRVLIATTTGPVEVLGLIEEEPAVGRSVACISGTTETADIDAGYNAFVARPTGIIERLFGHPCYRLDISGRIDTGSSWQLGVLAAHALHAAGRLALENDAAETVLWATGTVRPVDFTVGAVSHVEKKLNASVDRLTREAQAGRRVLVAVPKRNATDLSSDLRADLAGFGIDIVEGGALEPLWRRLSLPVGAVAGQLPADRSTMGGTRGRQPVWARTATVTALGLIALAALLMSSVSAYLLLLGPDSAPRPSEKSPPADLSKGPPRDPLRVPLADPDTYPAIKACLEARSFAEGRDFAVARQREEMFILPHVFEYAAWPEVRSLCLARATVPRAPPTLAADKGANFPVRPFWGLYEDLKECLQGKGFAEGRDFARAGSSFTLEMRRAGLNEEANKLCPAHFPPLPARHFPYLGQNRPMLRPYEEVRACLVGKGFIEGRDFGANFNRSGKRRTTLNIRRADLNETASGLCPAHLAPIPSWLNALTRPGMTYGRLKACLEGHGFKEGRDFKPVSQRMLPDTPGDEYEVHESVALAPAWRTAMKVCWQR